MKDYNQIYNEYKDQSEKQAISEMVEEPSDKEKIVAVRKNGDGDIIAFKTK